MCALVHDDGSRARLTVASAGHPLPLLLRRAARSPEPFGDHGVLLGVDGAEDWTEGDGRRSSRATRVLFYTDGVTETPGDAARFGELRLREAMTRAADGPDRDARPRSTRSLRDFQAGATIDDRAMLALQFLGVRAAAA